MSLPIRINYQGKDYSYKILTKGVSKYAQEIKILFNEQEYTLAANGQRIWSILETTVADQKELLEAIAKNIVLRYRL